ncbi:CLUMA_CG018830, isoform A [Clunio marinus]|uniref:CLUMA_CG018830, isoform A n=1 Tax=Clunio marinus TaxID=568069 RepID=A0A1J1J4K2_9DIPT|nr:CLUMA_CG018830, isoform A [Clunio marinus]
MQNTEVERKGCLTFPQCLFDFHYAYCMHANVLLTSDFRSCRKEIFLTYHKKTSTFISFNKYPVLRRFKHPHLNMRYIQMYFNNNLQHKFIRLKHS